MRRIVVVAIVMLLAMAACKGKTAKKVQTPQPAPVAVVEELKEDPVVEEVVPDPVIEAPTTSANDRYFLIAASFQELSNAEKYKQSLVNKGLSAQIIQRRSEERRVGKECRTLWSLYVQKEKRAYIALRLSASANQLDIGHTHIL